MNRRQFISTGAMGVLAAPAWLSAGTCGKRVAIRSGGIFVRECHVPGETRADDVFPAHPNGIRLSRARFLIVYATRGWRGVDDDRSIIYQVRADAYDGPVLKEGAFALASADWDAFGDDRRFSLSHGHPTAFGVPKGALIGGRPAGHANVFVAQWHRQARQYSVPGQLKNATETRELTEQTHFAEWVQFRLNDAADDIDILQPAGVMIQTGEPPRGTNNTYVAPVPFNDTATEWMDFHTLSYWKDGARHPENPPMGALKFRFNPTRRLYEWVETGPPLFSPDLMAYEGSAVRLPGGDWAVHARSSGWAAFARPDETGTAARSRSWPMIWLRTADPFGRDPGKIYTDIPGNSLNCGPGAAYCCADGIIRLLGGDKDASPYGKSRNPLYCWDIDPDQGFRQANRRVVFDATTALPHIRPETSLIVDMPKVLAHTGGRAQMILHRVRTRAISHDAPDKGPALLPDEKRDQGIYCARFEYDEACPDTWDFGSP